MKRLLKTLLITTIFLALITGCGKTSTTEEGSKDTSKQEKDEITITVMAVGTESEPKTQTYRAIADEFSANNEWGAKINMEFYEMEQYKTKLTTLMAANSVPDVFTTWELDYLEPFVKGEKVYPIGEILDKDTEWKESFADGVLEPLTYDNQVYGVPTQTTLAVMFYNKQIFEENGLEIPTTYEDFLNACQTLKDNDITPMTLSATNSWIPAQFLQQVSSGIGGLDLYSGILEGTRKWNDPAHVEAGEEIQMMIEKGYFQEGMLGMETEEVQAQFKQGKAAMYFMGTWDTGVLLDEETSEIVDVVGAFPLPAKNPEYNNIYLGSVDTSLAISESSQEKEIAAEFIKYFTSKESALKLLYEHGRLASTKVDFDKEKIDSLVAETIKISNTSKGLTPWWDRAFGAGEGVEFNNQSLAIFGGSDPQKAFDELQSFAEQNAQR